MNSSPRSLLLLCLAPLSCASLPTVKQRALAEARELSAREAYVAAADVVGKARRAHGWADYEAKELQGIEGAYRQRAELTREATTKGTAARQLALDLLFASKPLERAEPGDRRVPLLLLAWSNASPRAKTFFQPREVELLAEGQRMPESLRTELTRELAVVGFTAKSGGADRLRLRFTRVAASVADILGAQLISCGLKVEAEWTSGEALLVAAVAETRSGSVNEADCYESAARVLAPKVFRALIPEATPQR